MIPALVMQILLFIWGAISLGLAAALIEKISSTTWAIIYSMVGALIIGASIVMMGI